MSDYSKQEVAGSCQKLQQLCQKLNLGQATFELLRIGNAMVFQNKTDGVVARVMNLKLPLADVDKQLKVYEELNQLGMPILKPLRKAIKFNEDKIVTFWPLANNELKLSDQDVLDLVIKCHQTPQVVGLETWTAQEHLPRRLFKLERAKQAGAPVEILNQLTELLNHYQKVLEDYLSNHPFKPRVIHGDFYQGNVVELNSQLLLCDLDHLMLGPVERDLATLEIDYRRHQNRNINGDWLKMINNYPIEYDEVLLNHLVKVQEVGDCIFTCGLWGVNTDSHKEIIKRLKHFDDPNYIWQDF